MSAVYDGLGQRVQISTGAGTKTLIYDIKGQVVAEYGGALTPQTGEVRYLMMGHQGSTRAVTSETGNIVSRHDYTAFGEEIATGTGTRTVSQCYGNPYSMMPDDSRQRYAKTEQDENGLNHTDWRK
jgi:uncharacterized protein RhaS with RHS repeats